MNPTQICPFCGATDRLHVAIEPNTAGNVRFVRCRCCMASGPWSTKDKDATQLWNEQRSSCATNDRDTFKLCAEIQRAEADHLREQLREQTRQYGIMCTLRENANKERDSALLRRDQALVDLLPLRGKIEALEAELATLRATRDADHGAIEAEKIRPIYDQLCSLKMSHPHFVQLEWLDTLKTLITNSQQKGGESPCDPKTSTTENISPVAAPTSDPEGAATMFCPFCGEDDFDARGLKHHLLYNCATFGYTPTIQRP